MLRLSNILLVSVQFLAKANKSDLDEALPLKEIINQLDLKSIQMQSFGIYQISALKGTVVDEAFSWLFERVDRPN